MHLQNVFTSIKLCIDELIVKSGLNDLAAANSLNVLIIWIAFFGNMIMSGRVLNISTTKGGKVLITSNFKEVVILEVNAFTTEFHPVRLALISVFSSEISLIGVPPYNWIVFGPALTSDNFKIP